MRLFLIADSFDDDSQSVWSYRLVIKRGKLLQLRPALLSLEVETNRRRMLNLCYPNCIIIVHRSQRRTVWVHEVEDTVLIFEEQDMRQSCARCRVYDPLEWKFAKNAMTLGIDVRNQAIQRVVRDVFDVARLKEPLMAKLLGKRTQYYSFDWRDVNVLCESSDTLPPSLKGPAAAARRMMLPT